MKVGCTCLLTEPLLQTSLLYPRECGSIYKEGGGEKGRQRGESRREIQAEEWNLMVGESNGRHVWGLNHSCKLSHKYLEGHIKESERKREGGKE